MKLSSTSQVVKSITTRKYSVELMERNNGHYYIQSTRINESKETEDINDYNMANSLFSLILQEMEGQ